jgi:DNA primase
MGGSMTHLTDYLNEIGVPFLTEGKNVTPGWIEITCPFCGDPSYHLGISPQLLFHCWRCGEKGTIVKLLMELEGIPYYKAAKKASEFDVKWAESFKRDIKERLGQNILPKEAKVELTECHTNYLAGRGFCPSQLQSDFGILGVGPIGKYKFRVIAPCALQGSTVNFTALAVMGQSPKYIHCSNEEAIIPMKSLLYNIDNVRKSIVVVEGITDVWRIGMGSVAIMGMEFSKEQLALIAKVEVKNVFVMFDSGEVEQKKANRLAMNLSGIVDHVEVIELPEGDPGDLSESDVNHLREELKL